MHGIHGIKIITAKQAREINNYQKTKQKLHKAKAAIWFNKECRNKQLQTKYIQIKIKGNNKQNQNTKTAAIKFRLNQDIKFLYKKKQTLNNTLYKQHLEGANKWGETW
jgi:hypothetical protein